MDTAYAAYRTALDADAMTDAMHLEAQFYRAEERKERWTVIGITALWAAAAFPFVSILTQILA